MKWFIFLPLILLFIPATAHVPVVGAEGSSFSNPYVIDNPVKSWSIYLDLAPGELIVFSTTAPDTMDMRSSLLRAVRDDNTEFLPSIYVIGRDLPESVVLPFETPSGYGAVEIEVVPEQPVYEAFGPSVYQPLAEHTFMVSEGEKIFYAIQADDIGGQVSFVIGTKESFSPLEIILNPIAMIGVYLWEGQSWLAILLPTLLTVSLALIYYRRLPEDRKKQLSFMAYLYASIFLATTVTFLYQIIFSISRSEIGGEVVISLFILALQAGITLAAFRLTRNGSSSTKKLMISFFALLLWTGYVFAPILFILSGVRQVMPNSPDLFPEVVL